MFMSISNLALLIRLSITIYKKCLKVLTTECMITEAEVTADQQVWHC